MTDKNSGGFIMRTQRIIAFFRIKSKRQFQEIFEITWKDVKAAEIVRQKIEQTRSQLQALEDSARRELGEHNNSTFLARVEEYQANAEVLEKMQKLTKIFGYA